MKIKAYIFLIAIGSLAACTDLEEEIRDSVTAEEFARLQDVDALLQGAYQGMRTPYQNQDRLFAAQTMTGDACIGPTRGGDWDDNGVWRVLHDHTWSADHAYLQSSFDDVLQVVFRCTNILQFETTAEQAAEARLLRAFAMFTIVDGWDQCPFRDPGENLLEPARVLSGGDAMDFIIAELNAIVGDLPDGPESIANKDAAKVLLMKCYLNKGTFADRANPSFPTADMDQVITLADEIIASGKYALSQGISYYDNFAPNNDQVSSENIWTSFNDGGVSSGLVRARWFCTLHYNQNPSGWNGFATLGDFYDSFEDTDVRRGSDYTGVTDVSGLRVGLLFGQQLDVDGNELDDRKGNKLSFTKEVALIESGNNLEITGVRVNKYPPDFDNGDNADNDYVYFRYSDVLLMKAEAALRNGDAGTALPLVNDVRTARGATALGSIDLDGLLAERGREFYWENHRRTDLVRFGKFLDAWENKPASGTERLLFPIPANSLAVNPNLVQNPGY